MNYYFDDRFFVARGEELEEMTIKDGDRLIAQLRSRALVNKTVSLEIFLKHTNPIYWHFYQKENKN